MKLKEVVEFLRTKIGQLVTRRKMEELCDRAKQFTSKENIGNIAVKAKELASKENVENLAAKATSLASKEKLEEAKQCVKGLATDEGRKIAVDKFRSMPTKQKVISVCLAVLVVWFTLHIVSCVGSVVFGIGGQGGCKKIDADTNLLLTTLPTMEVEEGVGYPYFGIGFKALQWLPDEKSVIAVLDWNGGMGFSGAAIQAVAMAAGGGLGFLGGGLVLDEMKKNAQPIWLKTHKSYTDGASIDEQGIFVYDGIVTYKTKNGSRTVRGFTEVDPKFAKKYFDEQERKGKEREAKQKEAEEKALIDRNICDGQAVDLPDGLKIKSICGVNIGVPTKTIERNLGKRIELPKDNGRVGATYMLKKPFRVFDRVSILTTKDESPYKLVIGGMFYGNLDAATYSKEACRKEFSAIMSLLSEKYKLKFIRRKDFSHWVEAEIMDNEGGNIKFFCTGCDDDGDDETYLFTLIVDAGGIVEKGIEALKAKSKKRQSKPDSEKKQKVFSDKAGADVL